MGRFIVALVSSLAEGRRIMPKSRKPWLLSRVCETIEGAGLLIGVVSASTVALRKPPTTVLEKETYSAELFKRRRRLKEIRAGFKRFLAFLFSQIGLSLLVIGYTIIGGIIFRAVELENEKMVKVKGKELRTALADQFSGEIIRELRYQISSLNTWQEKYYIPLPKNKKSSEIPLRVKKNEMGSKIRRPRGPGGRTESEFARLRQWLHVIAYTLRHKTRQELHSSLRKLVKMMDHEGWNGEDSMDDLKWSWEGSILFAVTVITTIGEFQGSILILTKLELTASNCVHILDWCYLRYGDGGGGGGDSGVAAPAAASSQFTCRPPI
ncbi:hypothetical protein TSMEX_010724 [Taenia solium]|eukprot:TsM_000953600 transcript=TsM_000953600 gene=TsM_000953600